MDDKDKLIAKRTEIETALYKSFVRTAKRIQRLEWGKWNLVPDSSDPLRKFTLEKDIGWCTIKYKLIIEEFYHRADKHADPSMTDYWSKFKDYRGKIVAGGMFHDQHGDVWVNTQMKCTPRMARKLIDFTNHKLAPLFYDKVNTERTHWETARQERANWQKLLQSVPGLEQVNTMWNYGGPKGKLEGCPFTLSLFGDHIEIDGKMEWDKFAEFAKANGWGNAKNPVS